MVVQQVVSYFSAPRFERFSIEKEYPIQMGSDNRRADVVLINEDERIAAIIECKRSGYEGSGPDQLKSYLSATDTPLGVFANETDPADWQFYENRGRNQFKPVDRFQFEKQILKTNVIKTLINFVQSLFRRRSDLPPPTIPSSPEPIAPPIVSPDRSRIIHVRGDQSLQNSNNTDFDPNLNDEPYYSEASGFHWAANHHGMAECVPQHVKRIISNEELQIQSNREELQAKIDKLSTEKEGLEKQRHEYEGEIGQRSQDLARKRGEGAGLEVQLQAPTETELNPLSIEAIDQDVRKQQLDTEMGQLREKKDKLEREIELGYQDLVRKREELAGLEVQLQAPTETELNPAPESVPQVHAQKWYSRIFRLLVQIVAFLAARIIASVTTIVLITLAVYLFIFYASAVDKAFF